MPKVVRFYETGGPEVLKFEDVPLQEPGKGEVRLRVKAIGLNRADSMFYHGRYVYPPTLPAGLGYEAAGRVEAVGPDVDTGWIGKRVSSIPAFTLNEYSMVGETAVAPVAAIAEYPPTLSPAEGAAIWMQYVTAYGALVAIAAVTKGDFVVIPAASSSVGLAAIEIVKAEGGFSIATTRTRDKKEQLTKLGADYVIATDEEDYVVKVAEITKGKGARVTFDPVGGPFIEKLAAAAEAGGIIFEYGALSGQPTPFPLLTALNKSLSIRGYTLMAFTRVPEKLAVAKKYIYDRLAGGHFRPRIAKTFPFAQTVDAYRYLESNAQIGKVVVTVP
jgi:NADPH:quinone reductase-like Zn-dependent oxidoreductase